MVAEEEDIDPVSRRRTEIAALSTEEYASLEDANVEALRRLSNVSKVVAFHRGPNANQRGVRVSLTYKCSEPSRPIRACSAAVPNRAQAAELLLADMIEKHSECIRDGDRWSNGEKSAAPPAFSHIGDVQRKAAEVAAARQREDEHHRRVSAAKEAVSAAAEAELKSAMEREAAEAALAELKASFQSPKRQKAADGAATSSADVEAAAEGSEQNDDEPSWRSWTLPRWRKHEK
jgi:hypothetical protein